MTLSRQAIRIASVVLWASYALTRIGPFADATVFVRDAIRQATPCIRVIELLLTPVVRFEGILAIPRDRLEAADRGRIAVGRPLYAARDALTRGREPDLVFLTILWTLVLTSDAPRANLLIGAKALPELVIEQLLAPPIGIARSRANRIAACIGWRLEGALDARILDVLAAV